MLVYQTNRRLAIVMKFAAFTLGCGVWHLWFFKPLVKKMYVWNITNLCEILPQDEAILNSWSELKITTFWDPSQSSIQIADIVIFKIYFADMKMFKVGEHTKSYPSNFLKINFNKLVPGYEKKSFNPTVFNRCSHFDLRRLTEKQHGTRTPK